MFQKCAILIYLCWATLRKIEYTRFTVAFLVTFAHWIYQHFSIFDFIEFIFHRFRSTPVPFNVQANIVWACNWYIPDRKRVSWHLKQLQMKEKSRNCRRQKTYLKSSHISNEFWCTAVPNVVVKEYEFAVITFILLGHFSCGLITTLINRFYVIFELSIKFIL